MGLTPAAVNELKATNILNMRAGLVTTTDTFIDDGFTTSTTDLSIASDDLGKARDTLERFQNELQSVNVTEYDHYDLSEHEKDFTKSFKNILSDIEDNEKDSSGDRLPDKSQPIFSETEKSSLAQQFQFWETGKPNFDTEKSNFDTEKSTREVELSARSAAALAV